MSMIKCIQNLVKFCPSILNILSKNQFLTSVQGRNSVEHLPKKTLSNINIDLVDDNVDTKFGWILSIHSQDIKQNPIYDINQGL